MHYLLPWFPLSDALRRCIRRTTTDCYPYRSFLLGCRFGRSGSSGLVGRFLRLRLSNRGLVLRVRALRTHFTSWRFHTGYGLLQIITSSIFVQNLIAFTVLFLKIFFYISVLLLCTFN